VENYCPALIQPVLDGGRRLEYLAQGMMLADGTRIAIVMAIVVRSFDRGPVRPTAMGNIPACVFLR
jgi:hypothetical protein